MDAKFSAVGLGTGPPESISRRAHRILTQAREIYCPKSRNSSVSHSRRRLNEIQSFSGDLIEYPLAMQEGDQSLREDYHRAAREIESSVKEGRSVAAVTVGDPSLYSTLGPLVEATSERLPDESIRTIPGTSSIQTAASILGRPLAQRDQRFGIIPLKESPELSDDLFGQFETLAFTKVSRGFKPLVNRLADVGRSESSYLFERLGSESEAVHLLSEINSSRKVPYFSLVLSFEDSGPWD
ncbi:MAG: precorrin-2 C(20)-methyltransferase [bacterium]